MGNNDRVDWQRSAPPSGPQETILHQSSQTDSSTASAETIPPRDSTDSSSASAETLLPRDSKTGAALPSPPAGANPRYFGDYELIDEIARGGMGVVYKARQISLNRLVALKMILSGQLAGKDDVQRFRAEAEAAANLDHPGIVPIYEVGEHDGKHYFSMALVDGGSLSSKLKDGPLAPQAAATYVEKISRAIAFAHERGVIHRDLKPANVLLDRHGEPKVTDFGLAKQVKGGSQLTTTGQILGTPSYMPPEQAAGKIAEIGPSADIYSLGAILYAFLAGRPPFQSDNPMDTLLQVLEREPVPPRQLNPKLPADLETICLKCLEKSPNRRYVSAQALADEIGRYLRGEPILVRPISTVERGWRWCRRKPVLAALVMLAAVFAGVLCIGGPLWAMREGRLRRIATEQREIAQRQTAAAQRATAEANAQRLAAQRATEEANRQKKVAEEQRDIAEVRLYGSQIAGAQREWEIHAVAAAEKNLKGTRSDLRGWEHAYLSRLFYKDQRTLQDKGVYSISVSPDGTQLAGACIDMAVRIWDVATGKERFALKGHAVRLVTVAFSPDGTRLVSGGGDAAKGELRLWDAATGKSLHTLRGHTKQVNGAVFTPNSKRIVSGSTDKTVKIWDAETGQEVSSFEAHPSGVNCIAVSPDGKRIVSAGVSQIISDAARDPNLSFGTLKVWDADSHQEALTIRGDHHEIRQVACSPDGTKFASQAFSGMIRVWDAVSGKEIFSTKAQPAGSGGIAFSPDGKRLASGGADKTVKLWDAAKGTELATFWGHTSAIESLAFLPDGEQVVCASTGSIKIWNTAARPEPLVLKGHAEWVLSVAFSPDGKRIVSGSGSDHYQAVLPRSGEIKIWDAITGQSLVTLRGHTRGATSVAFLPDGKRIISASRDKTLKIWDAESGSELRTLEGHTGRLNCADVSPDGKWIISGSDDKTLKLWDAESGANVRTFAGHVGAVTRVAFSRDGKQIVSGSGDSRASDLIVWDFETAKATVRVPGVTSSYGIWPSGVTFSPDGKSFLSGSKGANLTLWDTSSGKELMSLVGHSSGVYGARYSPDGKRFASGGTDQTIKIWEATRGEELLTLRGHTSSVSAIAFSPDGSRIVSGSGDNTLIVWDASK